MEVSRTGLDDQGWPRDLILMVLVSEVPVLSAGSREPASASRPASGPNLDVSVLVSATHVSVLEGPGLDYNPA